MDAFSKYASDYERPIQRPEVVENQACNIKNFCGIELVELTDGDIEQLRAGKLLRIDVLYEYNCYVRMKS